jgi:hypothetical protein
MQRVSIFIDIYYYCIQLFTKKKPSKKPQCDDEPNEDNGFQERPDDEFFVLTTALQLLALLAVGVNIVLLRAASLIASKAFALIESPSTTTPVNAWKSESDIINKLLPNTKLYSSPHPIFFFRQYPTTFNLINGEITHSNSDRSTPNQSNNPPDSGLIKAFPRFLFEDFYILAQFYSDDLIVETIQRAFDHIHSTGSWLEFMLRGAPSALEMSKSLLSVYHTQDAYAGGEGWTRVLDPRVTRKAKSIAKKELQSDIGRRVQATTPNPMFLKRKVERGKSVEFAIKDVVDAQGKEIKDIVDQLRRGQNLHDCVNDVNPVVDQCVDRIVLKHRSVVSMKKMKDGSKEPKGSRAQGIYNVKDGKGWASGQMLVMSLDAGFKPVEGSKPGVSNLYDVFFFYREDVETKDIFKNVIVYCRSMDKPGKFEPNSWERASIQYGILKVLSLLYFYSCRNMSYLIFHREDCPELSSCQSLIARLWSSKSKSSRYPSP